MIARFDGSGDGKAKRCRTPRCRRAVTKAARSPFCPRCKIAKLKERHPATYAFYHLRSNAKRRGHACTLTLAEFKEWCEASGYLDGVGRMANCSSIDRINPARGYEAGNLRVVTVSMNSRLEHSPLAGFLRAQLEAEATPTIPEATETPF